MAKEILSFCIEIGKFVKEAEDEIKKRFEEFKDFDFVGNASVLVTVMSMAAVFTFTPSLFY